MKANTGGLKSSNRSYDNVPGFSVFVGKDIFTNYESQMHTSKIEKKENNLKSLNIESHIFHAK